MVVRAERWHAPRKVGVATLAGSCFGASDRSPSPEPAPAQPSKGRWGVIYAATAGSRKGQRDRMSVARAPERGTMTP
jgi:hypothetical protein